MKRSIPPLLIILAFNIFLLLTACGHERIGCEGEIIVQNPIPDTTLYVGGEPFIRDLNASPRVFVHTAAEIKNYTAIEGDQLIAEVSMEESEITGNLDVVVVKAVSEGETYVEVTAIDACPDGGAVISFQVTVRDTTDGDTNGN